MARVVIFLKGGPTPGPMESPTKVPPADLDGLRGDEVYRYVRTDETDARGRVIYVAQEFIFAFGELPDES